MLFLLQVDQNSRQRIITAISQIVLYIHIYNFSCHSIRMKTSSCVAARFVHRGRAASTWCLARDKDSVWTCLHAVPPSSVLGEIWLRCGFVRRGSSGQNFRVVTGAAGMFEAVVHFGRTFKTQNLNSHFERNLFRKFKRWQRRHFPRIENNRMRELKAPHFTDIWSILEGIF